MKLTEQLTALGGIFGVVVLGFILFFWLAPAPGAVQVFTQDQMVRAGSAMTGTTTAKVTMVEWGDFECPACGTLAPVLEQIIATYKNNPDFNFVFRNFPLPQHKNARLAAEAAEAAGAQGRYWDMYALLYKNQKEWTSSANPRASFDAYAKDIKLDLPAFAAALDTHAYAAEITQDYQDAVTLRLSHTPTIFLNGIEQTDTTFSSLKKAIDAALAK